MIFIISTFLNRLEAVYIGRRFISLFQWEILKDNLMEFHFSSIVQLSSWLLALAFSKLLRAAAYQASNLLLKDVVWWWWVFFGKGVVSWKWFLQIRIPIQEHSLCVQARLLLLPTLLAKSGLCIPGALSVLVDGEISLLVSCSGPLSPHKVSVLSLASFCVVTIDAVGCHRKNYSRWGLHLPHWACWLWATAPGAVRNDMIHGVEEFSKWKLSWAIHLWEPQLVQHYSSPPRIRNSKLSVFHFIDGELQAGAGDGFYSTLLWQMDNLPKQAFSPCINCQVYSQMR